MNGPADTAIATVLERLALAAGQAILTVAEKGPTVSAKADATPVTDADQLAESIILDGLAADFPDIPVVAEEEVAAGRLPASVGDRFFLVDALDGTREFVAGRPDFTVNIALVRAGKPVIGVVHAPARRRFFAGIPGHAVSMDVAPDGSLSGPVAIRVRPRPAIPHVVASRSHRTPETDAYLNALAGAEIVSIGSSLKFCLLAAGEADLYPRFGRTMEWDTAAGDAVLRAAGGMTRTLDGLPLIYGKAPDFANPYFIAAGAEQTGNNSI